MEVHTNLDLDSDDSLRINHPFPYVRDISCFLFNAVLFSESSEDGECIHRLQYTFVQRLNKVWCSDHMFQNPNVVVLFIGWVHYWMALVLYMIHSFCEPHFFLFHNWILQGQNLLNSTVQHLEK
jgi:hypothetical protein